MSEQLRHKMIDFEAIPPHSVWDAIAARLDDNKQYAALTGRMYNFETAPPPVWDAIAERLDDDKQYATVAEKMQQFETPLPATAWKIIAERLNDDRQYAAIATKMNNFDALPPTQIWDNIAASLQETKEQRVPVINIRKMFYRAAVAAVIASIVIGGWMFLNKSNQKTDFAKINEKPATAVPVTKEAINSEPVNTNNQKEEIASVQHSIVQHAASNQSLQGTFSKGEYRVLKPSLVRSLPSFREGSIVIHSSPIVDKNGNIIRDMDVLTTNNYLTVTGPNGQETRISAKFASVIRYLNGNVDDPEEYLDKVIKESDIWKKRFQEWRNKISQSSFIPSSSNFLDIIEFKELIQERQ